MKIQVTTEIEVPDGATHYVGELLEHPTWLKCAQVGVAGDHWWFWSPNDLGWFLLGHYKSYWAKEIPCHHRPALRGVVTDQNKSRSESVKVAIDDAIDSLRVIQSRRGYKIQQGDVMAIDRAIDLLLASPLRGVQSATGLRWSPEETARRFHEAFEEFAPLFGYATRPDTRAWNPDSPNGRLMIAVVRNVLIEQAATDSRSHKEGA